MTIHEINNSSSSQIQATILWQYCTAYNLRNVMNMLSGVFESTTEDFWDGILEDVANIDTANSFGLSVWGAILGVSRPSAEISGTIWTCSDDFYRNLLKAKFTIYRSGMSLDDLQAYADSVFGEGSVTVSDGFDMSIIYSDNGMSASSDSYKAFTYCPEIVLEYPAAVKTNEKMPEIVLGFEGQETGTQIDNVSIGNFGSENNEDSASFASQYTPMT